MDIAWWPLSKIAEPIYIYVVPINYGSNVFYHDHSMTRINYFEIFDEHQIVVALQQNGSADVSLPGIDQLIEQFR